MKLPSLLRKAVVAKIVAVGAIIPVQAASVIFAESLPASNVLLAVNPASTSNTQWRNVSGSDRWLGVSFTSPSNTSFEAITFSIYSDQVGAGALASGVTISILSVPGTLVQGPGTPYASALLYSETATLPATYGGQDFLTFSLSNPYALTAGTNYAVILSFNSAVANQTINLIGAPSSSYTAGNIGAGFLSTDGGGSYLQSNVYNFSLTAVPEPSAWILAAGGVGFLMALRGRVRRA